MKTLASLMITSFALIGAVSANAATEVAKVNGTTITLEEVNARFQENSKLGAIKSPSKKDLLDEMIKRELGIQEAKKLGLDREPIVQERIQNVLYQALLEKKLGKEFESIHVTDTQAKDYYKKNPEIRTSHIFVAVPPGSTPEEEKAAFERIKKIQDEVLRDGKTGFAEAAQRFSESAAAPMGGDIDYQTKDKLDRTYYDEAVKLGSPGKTSSIVKNSQGYYIIRLTAIRPWTEADKALVKRQVFDEMRAKIYEKYMGSLRSQAKVSVKDDLLN